MNSMFMSYQMTSCTTRKITKLAFMVPFLMVYHLNVYVQVLFSRETLSLTYVTFIWPHLMMHHFDMPNKVASENETFWGTEKSSFGAL